MKTILFLFFPSIHIVLTKSEIRFPNCDLLHVGPDGKNAKMNSRFSKTKLICHMPFKSRLVKQKC